MCFNCGCNMPSNAHGKADAITSVDFLRAGRAFDQTSEESMEHTEALIQKLSGEKPFHAVTDESGYSRLDDV